MTCLCAPTKLYSEQNRNEFTTLNHPNGTISLFKVIWLCPVLLNEWCKRRHVMSTECFFHAPPSAFRVEALWSVALFRDGERGHSAPTVSHVRMNQPLAVFTAPSGPRTEVWKALSQPVSEMLATVATMLVSRGLPGGISPVQGTAQKNNIACC